MRRSALIVLLCTLPVAADAAERVGLVLPLSGPEAAVAGRVEFGAQQALERLRRAGASISLTLVDDDCEGTGSEDAIAKLRQAEVEIVVGPICNASAEALSRGMPEVPVVSLDTRNPLLERRRKVDLLSLFELGSAPGAEAAAVVTQAIPVFDGKPWAMIDDGSLGARSLADSVRLLVEETSARPVEFANFRPLQRTQKPLLRRLNRSGVEAIVVAGSAEDVATISSDLKDLGYQWQLATTAEAELLPYVDGAGRVFEGTLALLPAPLPEAARSLAVEGDDEVEPALAGGFALLEIAAGYEPEAPLADQSFDTVLGRVAFGDGGRFDPLPPTLYQWRDGAFEPLKP